MQQEWDGEEKIKSFEETSFVEENVESKWRGVLPWRDDLPEMELGVGWG